MKLLLLFGLKHDKCNIWCTTKTHLKKLHNMPQVFCPKKYQTWMPQIFFLVYEGNVLSFDLLNTLNDSNYSMFSMKKWSLIFNICLHIMFQTGKRFEIFRGKVRTERAQRRRSVTAFHHEYWIKFCLASFGRFVIWYKNVAAHYA